jgi:predicted Zn-dependent protease
MMNPTTRIPQLFALVVALCACASDRAVIAQADDVHRGLEPAVIEEAELAAYLQEVGARVVAAADSMTKAGYGGKSRRDADSRWMFSDDLRFHLVASDELNAFTTGGEHMYVYSQLMVACRSEDELAAVVAHEYAHVYGRHVHKGMDRQYAVLGGALAAAVLGHELAEQDKEEWAAIGGTLALHAGRFLSLGFTRDDEAEADKLGFDFHARAGWDPARFGDFFQNLVDQGHDTPDDTFSDHPTLRSRVAAAKARAAKLPSDAATWRRPPVADAQRFAALKQRAAAVAAKQPRGDALAVAQTLLASVPSCVAAQDSPGSVLARARLQAAESR